MKKRMLKGSLIIIVSMIMSILMTFLYDYLVKNYGHEDRFGIIFSISGGILAFVSVMYSIAIWTNNFGEGFKD